MTLTSARRRLSGAETPLSRSGTRSIATPKHEGYLEPSTVADAIVYITQNTAKNAWVRDLVVLPLGF